MQRYRTSIVEEGVGRHQFRFHCITDFESAIDQMFLELEARGAPEMLEELCPYFGTLWPSARALARWMSDNESQFRGRRVLEVGCGLALPSFLASRTGAQVVASDAHPDVPEFIARNQALNGCHFPYQRLDWRTAPPFADDERFDWVLASDVLYEKHHPESLLRFLDGCLSPGGRAAVLDPNRSYWERLVVLARGRGLQVETETLGAEAQEPRRSILVHLSRYKTS